MNNQQAPILTDDEIKAAAIEAGAVGMRENAFGIESFPWGCEFEIDQLRRFVGVVTARAVAAEREACARILDENSTHCTSGSPMNIVLRSNAAAIRARGEV